VAALAATRAGAQDTRTVTEPVVPPACATLRAELATVGDTTIAGADERRLDTKRIQQAIDGCAKGRAVVLRADGERRAFLSGALDLRPGVTLVVGEGAVLLGNVAIGIEVAGAVALVVAEFLEQALLEEPE
jgi:polygalacturonase